ncbi:MAG: glycosyltransferase family 39 protein [Dehalococcoidia bacterium]
MTTLLLAAALRFVDLQTAPPGFWYDEGLNGQFARDILTGDLRLFYGDREGLFFYVLAGAIALFGDSIMALRWTGTAVGLLTVAATFSLGRRLLGMPTGLVAAAGMAASFWHFAINRFAERVNLLPLFEIVTVYCLFRALYPRQDEKSRHFALLAGLAGGLTLYTYLASRFFPFVLLGFLVWQVVFDRRALRSRWAVWPMLIATAGLVFLPLGIHYLRFPNDFILRSSQVWPYSGLSGMELAAELIGQFGVTLGMFGVAGDLNWRHNIAGRPAFDLVAAVALAAGLFRAFRRPRRAATAMAAIWLLVMLLPSVLATDNPHFLRSFGALPAAWLLAAHGGVWIAALAASTGGGRRVAIAAGVVWALWATWGNASAYFVEWRSRPEALTAFEAGVPAGAAVINALPTSLPVYGSAWIRPHPAVDYLLEPGRAVRWFSGDDGLVLPERGEAAVALFNPATAAGSILRSLGGRIESASVAGPDGEPRFRLYHVEAPVESAALATFGGVIQLEGVEWGVSLDGAGLPAVTVGKAAPVTLRFRVLAPPDRPDLAFSVRLVEGGQTRFQDDAAPFFSDLWQTGEQIFVRFEIETDEPGVRTVDVAVYERDGEILSAFGPTGARLGDRAPIGRLKVTDGVPAEPSGPPVGRFDGGIVLRSGQFQQDACSARFCPGALKLVWEAIATPRADLSVFVHLAGPDGRPIAQADGPPAGGLMPTTTWAPGERVVDIRRDRPTGSAAGRASRCWSVCTTR